VDNVITGIKDQPSSIVITPDTITTADTCNVAVILSSPAAAATSVNVRFSDLQGGGAVTVAVPFTAGQMINNVVIPPNAKALGSVIYATATVGTTTATSGLLVVPASPLTPFLTAVTSLAQSLPTPRPGVGIVLEYTQIASGTATHFVVLLDHVNDSGHRLTVPVLFHETVSNGPVSVEVVTIEKDKLGGTGTVPAGVTGAAGTYLAYVAFGPHQAGAVLTVS
jgi:hypothetical protein